MKRILLILACVFGLILIFNLVREIMRFSKSGERLKQAQEQVEQLKVKNWQLKQEKQYRESDDFAEKEIRDKLMMAKEGELVVVLPQEIIQKIASSSASEEGKVELPAWRQWWSLFW